MDVDGLVGEERAGCLKRKAPYELADSELEAGSGTTAKRVRSILRRYATHNRHCNAYNEERSQRWTGDCSFCSAPGRLGGGGP